jgi:hypothetical protein
MVGTFIAKRNGTHELAYDRANALVEWAMDEGHYDFSFGIHWWVLQAGDYVLRVLDAGEGEIGMQVYIDAAEGEIGVRVHASSKILAYAWL